MEGRRVDDYDDFWAAGPGTYMKTRLRERGESFEVWFVRPPCGDHFFLAHDPREGAVHEVDEHEDGTITVEPKPGNSNSVLCRCGWHGYIDRGVWRSV